MSKKFSEEVHLKCIQALRIGGFVCLLPHVIDPEWGGHALCLAGFPIRVCFTGLSPGSEQESQLAVTSCYTFDPSTYFENADFRTMTYFTSARSDYRVELVYRKRARRWEGQKLCGEKALFTAAGPELRQFSIQLTMRGTEADEPVQNLQALENIVCEGIYVFTPNPLS